MMWQRLVIAAGCLALCASGAHAQESGNAQTGKQLFQAKGCYSCHGFVGQGSREGPRLTPPLAFPAFIAQLRTPRAIMPPYEPALVSDGQAADSHAYLASQPKPPDAKSLKLLQ
jgi:ubiquinol-cytochrome c reductase cytochrome c subunit